MLIGSNDTNMGSLDPTFGVKSSTQFYLKTIYCFKAFKLRWTKGTITCDSSLSTYHGRFAHFHMSNFHLYLSHINQRFFDAWHVHFKIWCQRCHGPSNIPHMLQTNHGELRTMSMLSPKKRIHVIIQGQNKGLKMLYYIFYLVS
jgi:hypothetical protein